MAGGLGARLVFVVALGATAGVGYWVGQVRSSVKGGMGRGTPEVRSPVDNKALLDVVYGRKGTREQWPHIRDFSEAEVRAALAALGDSSPEGRAPAFDARAMLYYRWAEIDPVAANESIKRLQPDGFSYAREAVVTAWIKKDASAAWKATKDEEQMWACTRSVGTEVADMLVASYSDDDDATAFQKAGGLDDEENCILSDLLVRARAKEAAADPQRRALFLRVVSQHPYGYIRSQGCQELLLNWADVDPEAALAAVGSAPFSENSGEWLREKLASLAEEKKARSGKEER